jgi:hypothetical protein
VGLTVVGAVVLASPLTTVVQERLDNPHSDGVRTFTITKTLEATEHSPVLGFGSSRRPLGSNNSIAVGRDESCATCGNPPLGSTGQLWLLLISHGYVGTGLYLAYQVRSMWAFRGDRSMLAGAAMLSLVLPLLYMLLYNALVIPLLITFLGIGLLWRNQQERPALGSLPPVPATAVAR